MEDSHSRLSFLGRRLVPAVEMRSVAGSRAYDVAEWRDVTQGPESAKLVAVSRRRPGTDADATANAVWTMSAE